MQVLRMIPLLAGLAALAFRPGGATWESAEAAAAKSALTGKPICYYFTNNGAEKEGGT